MFWELYALLTVFAGASTLALFLVRKSIVPLGLLTGGLWSVLALQARNIVVYHQDGTSTTVGSEPWQFIALGLAVLTIAAAALHLWGVFPPDEGELAAIDQQEDLDNGTTEQRRPTN